VACVPWFKVVSRALEALAAARRFTPRGSLTQTGNGSAGAASGTVPGDFGIGSEAGHVVGDACGLMLPEGEA